MPKKPYAANVSGILEGCWKALENLKKISARLCKCNKKHAQNLSFQTCFLLKLAERKGFEPLCAFAQTDFESAPLWPLRYLSVYTNLDFYPFEAPENGGIFARDATIILNLNPRKSLINQGFQGIRWTIDGRISSAAPSTTRTTLRVCNSAFLPKTFGKNWRKEQQNI